MIDLNRTNIWAALSTMARWQYRTTVFNPYPLAPCRIRFGTSQDPVKVLDTPLWGSLR